MADAAKLKQLQAALEAYVNGDAPPLFDHQAEEAKAKVRKRALRLLDQRARSRHELRQRLVQLEYPGAVVTEVLDDLERVGLIDDARFAAEWVRQRSDRRGKSKMALNLELKNKGISKETRDAALAQIGAEDEFQTATKFAEKKARSIDSIDDRADYARNLRRILGVLARRGFSAEVSMRVAREALDNRIEELRG
ncbi:MAG: regulatory protein RecX [Corynebacterium sp.]|nr:regulatory protein RecX [Corynebacterium sp.]